MGRRSINTTKSGKYMNPTDQARKEARKKELKKNKKQRQMVRAAVLKGKDPHQIISELERIDQMEYNVLQPSPLNEKVLKDKRKKLKDTLDRVLKMYDKDDPERWAELKTQEADYEKRRTALLQYYEAVRHAQQVQIEEIPLPISLTGGMPDLPGGLTGQIPLPAGLPLHIPPPPSILRKRSAYSPSRKPKKAPGVPPGPPPELSDDEEDGAPMDTTPVTTGNRRIRFEDDSDERPPGDDSRPGGFDDDQDRSKVSLAPTSKPQPTALQQKMLAMAGQDIDQFMKEMEEVHKRKEADRQADLDARLAAIADSGEEPRRSGEGDQDGDRHYGEEDIEVPGLSTKTPPGPPPLSSLPPGPPPLMSLPHMMFRPPPPGAPPPPPPMGSVRMPPGPPPGRPPVLPPSLPPGPPPGLPPRVRLPPGPPPGMPPRLVRMPGGGMMPMSMPPLPGMPAPPGSMGGMGMPMGGLGSLGTPNVLSAAPQLINRADGGEAKKLGATTIEAKPQIRNLSADVTRFLPTALRVKRDEKMPVRTPRAPELRPEMLAAARHHHQGPVPPGRTKDDAYQQFMREMEGLL